MIYVLMVSENRDGSVEVSIGEVDDGTGSEPDCPALHVFQKMKVVAYELGAEISELPR